MSEIRSYRDLVAWQEAIEFASNVYRLTKSWPKEEVYGLTSQARRSAASIAANIAEGYGRNNLGSYLQFLRIAQGSLKECETHLIIAQRVNVAPEQDIAGVLEHADRVGRILGGLIRKLQSDS